MKMSRLVDGKLWKDPNAGMKEAAFLNLALCLLTKLNQNEIQVIWKKLENKNHGDWYDHKKQAKQGNLNKDQYKRKKNNKDPSHGRKQDQ